MGDPPSATVGGMNNPKPREIPILLSCIGIPTLYHLLPPGSIPIAISNGPRLHGPRVNGVVQRYRSRPLRGGVTSAA